MLLERGQNFSSRSEEESKEKRENVVGDPTLFVTMFKRRRFGMITSRPPSDERDILNEAPTEEEKSLAPLTMTNQLAKEAVLRTSMGDVFIRLFSSEVPITVENFTTHSKVSKIKQHLTLILFIK